MKLKKADISMNTIVVAVIAITVLLVIILIFTTNIRKPANEVKGVSDSISITECKPDNLNNINYKCVSDGECDSGKISLLRNKYCKDNGLGDVCCQQAQT